MLKRIISSLLLVLLCSVSPVLAVKITREGGATQLLFDFPDFIKTVDDSHFEYTWLNDNWRYRDSCFLHTHPINIPHQAFFQAVVQYEAQWLDVISDVSELSGAKIARFDISYEDTQGKYHQQSQFITANLLGSMDWLSQGSDFIQIQAATQGVQTTYLSKQQIPAGSKNVRVAMCGIGPNTRIRVDRIDLTMSEPSQFLEASSSVSNGPLRCFDSGLFLSNCRFDETVLDEASPIEFDYDADFEFDCRGHEVELSFVSSQSTVRIHPQSGQQRIGITGYGLRLVDGNSERTRRATFDHGCILKIISVEKIPSKKQQEEFTREREHWKSVLKDAQTSAQAFVDLNVLARTIDAIKTALKLLNTLNRSSSSLVLIREDSSLESLLSKQQLKSLETIMKTKNILVESDQQYSHFKRVEEEARQKLQELICLSERYSGTAGEGANECS